MSIKSELKSLWNRAEADEKTEFAKIVAAEHDLVERTPWWVLAGDGSLIFLAGVAVGYFV